MSFDEHWEDDKPVDTSVALIKSRTVALQERVYAEEYFPYLWQWALERHNITDEAIKRHEVPEMELVEFANTFWDRLPDASYIRTGPFFALCDLCQEDYRDDS